MQFSGRVNIVRLRDPSGVAGNTGRRSASTDFSDPGSSGIGTREGR